MIVPYPFMTQMYAEKMRKYIISNNNLIQIADLSTEKIFKDATVKNCIYLISNEKQGKHIDIFKIDNTRIIYSDTLHIDKVVSSNNYLWNIDSRKSISIKIKNKTTLGEICFISKGMVLNADEKKAKGKFKKRDLISNSKSDIHSKEYIEAKDIGRYRINRKRWLEWNTKRVPQLISRPTFKQLYETEKLLVSKIGSINAIFDNSQLYCDQTLRVLILWCDLKTIVNKSINNSVKKWLKVDRAILESNSEQFSNLYLLGILNSKFTNYQLNKIRGIGNIDINPDYLRKIIIPIISRTNKDQSNELIKSVISMMNIQNKLQMAKTESDIKFYQQQITAINNQIDKLIYKLYELTDEEIKLVEE